MRRLIVSTQQTVDGVIEWDEGWFTSSGSHETHGLDDLRAADALLLGRKTYEGLAAVWPTLTGDYAPVINGMPKYVASRTLTGPLEWNATLLEGDLEASVRALKEEPGGPLLSYGCGELAYRLVEAGLVDDVRFYVHPTVWGDGERAFRPRGFDPDGPVRLRLVSTTGFDSGITLQSYRPVGVGPA